jgi:TolB-like protein/tRNA A-37 threonylcarbamoyl transferase component Bud32
MDRSDSSRSFAAFRMTTLQFLLQFSIPMDHLTALRESLSGQYVIDRELGGGGMSRVYVAEETRLRRRVVIKVVSPELAQGLSIERFEREIQLAASLSQANIVPVLSAGDTNGLPYFTMPFVDGESLRHRLKSGPLPIAEIVNVLRDVCRALSYAHKHGIVHRDIKPDNVLLSSGAAVVTDFGIAKALAASKRADGPEDQSVTLTQTGMSIGTAAYMSPEQAAGDPAVDHRADIYSLGCMAYELLAGKPPFVRESMQRVLAAHLTEKPRPISEARSDTPPALAAIVMRSLEKDPLARPQSADEVVHALDGIDASSGFATRARPPQRILMFASIGAIAIAVAFTLWGRKPGAGTTATARTLAVLPIENVGGDSTKEYLADGMTGELAGNLRQTPGLEVVGDLSTARFKRSTLAPADIAGQLHVAMLLSGKLQSQGKNIRLQMQLNDDTGKLLWSQTFDREMKDNFAMQDEIAAVIAREMRVALSPTAKAGRTENPAAHELYLQGRAERAKLDGPGLKRSESFFNAALKLDPGYAQAHAGLSLSYDMQADVYAPSHEYHLKALKEARLAVAADSMLAEGHVLLGFELAAANWDFEGGLAEMNRGLALNPASPDALFMVAAFSFLSGNTSRALGLADSLIQVDPLSPLGPHARAEALLMAGHWDDALKASIAAKKIDSTVFLLTVTDAEALRELGRFEESLAAFLNFRKIADVPMFGLTATYEKLGRRADALREIHALEARFVKEWIEPNTIAIAYAGIGDRENAVKWLEKGVEMKTYFSRLAMNWDFPWLRNMQDYPRYIALKQKVLATKFKE